MMSEIRIPRKEVREYREQKMTYEEIGIIYGVTRQRIYQIVTDWGKKYSKTPRYKMYRRHIIGHKIDAKPYKPCIYCQ